MRDEHFGISVVEGMAAGAVPLAHNSAGPAMDIVVPWHGQQTGILAVSEEEYAEGIHRLLSMPEDQYVTMQQAARSQSQKFSDAAFDSGVLDAMQTLF